MNITETLKDAILANLGPLKQAPKNWSKRNCPLCHIQGHGRDTRKRFGIQFNVDSVVLNCFNCGFSASYTDGEELSVSFKVFLNQIHIDKNFIRQIEFEIFKQKNQISSIREGTDTSGNKESKLRSLFQKWQPLDLPEDSLSIKQWLESGLDDAMFLKVVNYAISRKLYDLDKFYWSPITLHNMNQRIIIPYRYKDNNVGYTARLCYDLPDKSIPKYFQRCPTDFIYNIDSQQGWARKYVIVNEGVLDAWVTDGVSTLGDINQAKIDIINRNILNYTLSY